MLMMIHEVRLWQRRDKLPMMSHSFVMSMYFFDIFAVSLDSIRVVRF